MNRREGDQYQQRRQHYQSEENRGDDSNYRGAYRFDDHRTARDDYHHYPDSANNNRSRGQNYADERENRGRADQHNTIGGSNNYGNMGSYGGAQGFGSSRAGFSAQRHPQERSGFDATSGHGPQGREEERGHGQAPNRQLYGAYRDQNSYSSNEGPNRNNYHDQQHRGNWRDYQDDQNRRREEDSRYEIYDSAQSMYNRGNYGYSHGGSVSRHPNQRTHIDDPRENYGSRQRPHFRQGSGNDQQHNVGNEMDYTNVAGSLSDGYDGYRGPAEPQYRHYDPLSGRAHEQDISRRGRPDERGFNR
ncbi:MAG: hypothetical protein M3142_15815 [Bacteroidota bacterium]|nr:hypothetical protein [Bacteroidota bacterium]